MVLSEEVQQKVRQQVEFYFSDSNAPRDSFLLDKIKSDPEGHVDLSLICTFTRMAKLLGLPPKPSHVAPGIVAQVADALEPSQELALSACRRRVRRRRPLPDHEAAVREMDARSVFSGPLPFDCSLDELTRFFATAGPVNAVRMRRHLQSKDFRGSVFVEFASPEAAQQVVREARLVYAGAEQRLEMKADYMARKAQGRAAPPAAQATAGGAGAKRGAAEAALDGGSPPAKRQAAEQPAAREFQSGLVLELRFPDDAAAGLHYGAVKAALGGGRAGVAFCQAKEHGAPTFLVRMHDGESAAGLLAKRDADGGLPVTVTAEPGGAARELHAALRVLEGEEEREFHRKAAEQRAAGPNRGRSGGGPRGRGPPGRGPPGRGRGPAGRRGGGGGGRRGGRGFGRGRVF